jgi:hypothetical protein
MKYEIASGRLCRPVAQNSLSKQLSACHRAVPLALPPPPPATPQAGQAAQEMSVRESTTS